MRYGLWGILAALLLCAIAAGWPCLDLAVNYTPVTGVVTSTSVLCYLQKGDDKVADKVTHTTIEVPCNIAEMAVQPGQARAGFVVMARTTLHYRYLSPVDEAWHSGSVRRGGTPDKWPQRDARVKIYAHNKQAETSKYVG